MTDVQTIDRPVSDDEIDAYLADLTAYQREKLAPLTPDMRRQVARVAILMQPSAEMSKLHTHLTAKPVPLVEFAHKKFYIPETRLPIRLFPHQIAILNYMFDPKNDFQTMVFSTVKKSGKTALAALVARWIAETWGPHVEVYCLANDYEQAKGRIYDKVIKSVELTPGYLTQRRTLPGQWHIVERDAKFLPSSSSVKAVSGDYKGEAGSNPTATFWSELWAYTSENNRRLWDELTPVPTRERSIRFVETYAGYTNESNTLLALYRLGTKKGDRLSRDDLFGWPFDEQPPVYVNEAARMVMYWDDGPAARRLPWQTPVYYAAQEATLRPEAFDRLHNNYWTTSVGALMPVQWFDACYEDPATINALIDPAHTSIVLGVDAAVTSDCAVISAVARDPRDPTGRSVLNPFSFIWTPPPRGSIDLQEIEDRLRAICAQFNVEQIAYDAYQLHKMMTDLVKDNVAWCRAFSQGANREVADKQLYDLIRTRRFHHAHGPLSQQREHIENAAAKTSKEEDTRMRIVKKSQDQKIDYAVATSMAAYECLRLVLD